MSETELEVPTESSLPESAVQSVIEAISVPESVHIVNDVEIDAVVDSMNKLSGVAVNSAERADMHSVAEATHATKAETNFSAAEHAKTEDGAYSFENRGERHEIAALDHHVDQLSSAIRSEEASAGAASMERIATVQIAAQEISVRTEYAVKEIADKTVAGVKEEMRIVAAAAEEMGAPPAQNLESELEAQAELGAPKV